MRASAALKAMARLFASAWGRLYVRSFRAISHFGFCAYLLPTHSATALDRVRDAGGRL